MISEVLVSLELANDELAYHNLKAEVLLMGGAAVILNHIDFRETMDIDVFIAHQSNDVRVKEILNRYRINDDLKRIATIPTLDDFTFSDVIEMSHLTVHVASLEDLAMTKLFTSRPKDYDDLVTFILPQLSDKSSLSRRCQQYESSYVGNLEMTNYYTLKQSFSS